MTTETPSDDQSPTTPPTKSRSALVLALLSLVLFITSVIIACVTFSTLVIDSARASEPLEDLRHSLGQEPLVCGVFAIICMGLSFLIVCINVPVLIDRTRRSQRSAMATAIATASLVVSGCTFHQVYFAAAWRLIDIAVEQETTPDPIAGPQYAKSTQAYYNSLASQIADARRQADNLLSDAYSSYRLREAPEKVAESILDLSIAEVDTRLVQHGQEYVSLMEQFIALKEEASTEWDAIPDDVEDKEEHLHNEIRSSISRFDSRCRELHSALASLRIELARRYDVDLPYVERIVTERP